MRQFITFSLLLTISIILDSTVFSIQQPAQKNLIKLGLIEPGTFHGDEVRARSGQEWLGLFDSKTEEALRLTTVRITKAHDPVVDETENKKTGKDVSTTDKEPPLFLVRGIDTLKPGPIKTAFKRKTGLSLNSETPITIKLGEEIYTLSVKSKKAIKGENLLRSDSKLVLSFNSTSQIIYSFRAEKAPKMMAKEFDNLDFGDVGWSLFWAGDIDGDGKLDLYLDAPDFYNASHPHLFFSSKALPNKLVKEVAAFRTLGC